MPQMEPCLGAQPTHRHRHSAQDPSELLNADEYDQEDEMQKLQRRSSRSTSTTATLPGQAGLCEAALRRASSEPVFEEERDRRLLHALKNQQRWLVNWILNHSDVEEGVGELQGALAGTPLGDGLRPLRMTTGPSAPLTVGGGGDGGVGGALRPYKRVGASVVHERDKDERTALHLAAKWGDLEIVKRLVAKGADVRVEDAHGHTPIDEAEYWGHTPVVEYLRSLGTQKEEVESVVEAGDVRMLKDLLLRGLPIKDFVSLLHRAAAKGDEPMIRLLLAAGVDPEQRDEEDHTAAEVALMGGHMAAFEMLVSSSRQQARARGAHPMSGEGTPETGIETLVAPSCAKTPLHAAAECGSVEAVSRLGKMWPVDALDAELNTPLHVAIINGHPDVARVLVKDLKADVNKRNRWGTTPLAEAVRLGQDEIATLLRDSGACLFLEIDSQQVIMEPRDQYFLRLELVTSLLYWAAVPHPRPAMVRFFHTTHHNSLLLCCSVRPRLVPDNRSSSSSIRSWGSSIDDGETDDTGTSRGEEEADAVLAHLVLDDRSWFLADAFKTTSPVVVSDAANKDPNELFLSPVMAYTQHRHLAVLPVVIDGRRLGAFVLLFKTPDPPRLPPKLQDEVRMLISGADKDLQSWLQAPATDAPRLQLLLQSRLFKAKTRDWVAAVYSQESYNFWGPNHQMCAVIDALYAHRRAILLPDICQRCPWVQSMVDAIFYMSEVLLPVQPSRPLFNVNMDTAQELRSMGLRAPDLRTQDSPVYSNWLQQVRRWTEQADAMERALLMASAAVSSPRHTAPQPHGAAGGSGGGMPAVMPLHRRESSSGSIGPWAFSHRDVFDLIGKHKYDHTLPEMLSSFANCEQAFPWHDRSFAEGLASKLAGSGAMRQGPVLGVVTHYLYRTFLHPQELAKAWHSMQLIARKLLEGGRPATGVFIVYKSVLEFLHPFHDGNGRFARCVASILLRRAGFHRALLHSDNKILSLQDFFDILSKEVSHRSVLTGEHQKVPQLQPPPPPPPQAQPSQSASSTSSNASSGASQNL